MEVATADMLGLSRVVTRLVDSCCVVWLQTQREQQSLFTAVCLRALARSPLQRVHTSVLSSAAAACVGGA